MEINKLSVEVLRNVCCCLPRLFCQPPTAIHSPKQKNQEECVMEINQLPVELLMKIFSYLPRYDNVSLVNRHFYNVACNVNDSKICLSLESFDDRQLLQSINSTNRKISKVSFTMLNKGTGTELRTAIAIIKKFSATIKYLKLKAWLQVHEFLEILSLVPNAEHLIFEQGTPPSESQEEHPIMLRKEDLNLHQLKKLWFWRYNDEFTAVLNRLPVGVLTELAFWDKSFVNTAAMHGLFKRQTNIKNLGFIEGHLSTIVPDIFDNLKLDTLFLWYPCNDSQSRIRDITAILSKQTKLKALAVLGKVDEVLMNAMTSKLTELESLGMLSFTTPAAIENIGKFKNLNNLMLGCARQHLESFAKLDNSRITTLRLMDFSNVSVDLIGALVKSVPNLKVFWALSITHSEVLSAIIRNFNFVEVLEISQKYDQSNGINTTHSIQADCLNAKLIEFNVDYLIDYNIPFLEQLIAVYPNLKKLTIKSQTPITAPQLKLIMKGFTKLESLSLLRGASKLTAEDLACLKNYKNNLKFMSLRDFDIKLITAGREKKLRAMFDVVSCKSCALDMAVDRNTLKRERDIFELRNYFERLSNLFLNF